MLSTAFGLAVAVLADRAKGENIAKSLIFLPMAISFVGAGVIWTLMYQPRNISDPQTGVLNAHVGRARRAEQLRLAEVARRRRVRRHRRRAAVRWPGPGVATQ